MIVTVSSKCPFLCLFVDVAFDPECTSIFIQYNKKMDFLELLFGKIPINYPVEGRKFSKLSHGVMVALVVLVHLVMVRIHVGQPMKLPIYGRELF